MQNAVEEYDLKDKVTLAGSFCIGKCTHTGVTVQVDEEVYTGITRETFKEFLNERVLSQLR